MWPFTRGRGRLERILGRILLANMEARTSLENPQVSLADPNAWAALFGAWHSASGIEVTLQRALGVPAVWCAVNFIADTFAALPAPVYRKSADGKREKLGDDDAIHSLLNSWVNDDYLTSFAWRKYSMVNTLMQGRSFTFIERNAAGSKVLNLWPLEFDKVKVERVGGRRRYKYRDGRREVVYQANEVIDVPFMMAGDNISAFNPIHTLKNALGLAIALEEYASRFFQNGGVPPLAMQMPPAASPGATRRAVSNIEELLKISNEEGRLVLPMPLGHRLEQIGFRPQEGQLIEARQWQVLEVARIYMLPPVFLQDLSHGTYSNTEQQDLMLVKHTLTQWLKCWEQELNAKLFGPRSRNYVEFNVDGLLRGDFASRMSGHATSIQNGIRTPDECRDLENLPRKGGAADKLLIQGATVPLDQGLSPEHEPNDEGAIADDQA
jgi:HK97 family phage portal protein